MTEQLVKKSYSFPYCEAFHASPNSVDVGSDDNFLVSVN